jgi:hypothetical protein
MIRSNQQAHSPTTTQQRLQAKWAELLGIDASAISAESDFFSLGGNSMLLLCLHNFVTQEFNLEVQIPDLIENATFSHMLELIHSAVPR